MGKHTNEFKLQIVNERLLKNKGYVQIERETGVLRGTTFSWVKKYQAGTLFIDKRTTKDIRQKEIDEYEFLKKSYALLKDIRSKQQE